MIFNLSIANKKLSEGQEISCLWRRLGSLHDINAETTRVNITLSEEAMTSKEIEQLYTELDVVKEKFPNYTVSCTRFIDLKELLNKGYNAYLNHAITDWELFTELKQMGVSDILIDGPIAFNMDALKRAKDNVKIRVCPHNSTNILYASADNLNSFFIRPEDLHYYEPYIDVIDFRKTSTEREAVLFKIYKQGYFLYDLSELITQLGISIDNNFIYKTFGEHRLNCGQRCKDPTKGPCHLCYSHLDLAKAIQKVH